jgi:UDPglucose--hexose-1-phosphate uridylyltransferase
LAFTDAPPEAWLDPGPVAMTELLFSEHPHRRYNPLRREWVLVSPHRTRRPWQGQVERATRTLLPPHDAACYLCPGNTRAGGVRNPSYERTFVFDNDFSALRPETPDTAIELDANGLVLARGEPGICRVVCFSPRHDLTIARMSREALRHVVDVWTDETIALARRPGIAYVQVFENRGEMMGCSNPHPHGQIWASASVPNEPASETVSQDDYWRARGRCLLCDYLAFEAQSDERLVIANEHFVALVPFWAVWPFEVLLAGRRHVADLPALDDGEREGLADILKQLTTRYDNLFEVAFPYSMGFHPRPADGAAHPGWHLHAHFYPPLLRSATVRKFMVGYEMLGSPQRDITPEAAAELLRETSDVHYTER